MVTGDSNGGATLPQWWKVWGNEPTNPRFPLCDSTDSVSATTPLTICNNGIFLIPLIGPHVVVRVQS